jgi:hypothetical protein
MKDLTSAAAKPDGIGTYGALSTRAFACQFGDGWWMEVLEAGSPSRCQAVNSDHI